MFASFACVSAEIHESTVASAEAHSRTDFLQLRSSCVGETIVRRAGDVPSFDPFAPKRTELDLRRTRKLNTDDPVAVSQKVQKSPVSLIEPGRRVVCASKSAIRARVFLEAIPVRAPLSRGTIE
jgi:hypothetical protein